MSYVLSNYPLSRPFRAQLEDCIRCSPEYIVVSELRQKSVRALFRRMFAAKGPALYVAMEDDSSQALLPVLSMLAALSRAQTLHSVDGGLTIQPLSRVRAIRSGIALFQESLLAMRALRHARRDMQELLKATRIPARVTRETSVAYLNCNLWFGVKAGGSVGHISGVANALMDLGHPLTFFSAGGRLLVDERAEYVRLRPPRMQSMPFETTYYRFDFTCEQQIAARFASRSPGFIYQRMSIGNYTGVRLSRRFGIPLILEYNGSEAWIAKNWGRPLRYHAAAVEAEDVCLRHSHLIVTVSEVLGRELESRGVERERIVVYPNCIDPAMFDPGVYSAEELANLRAGFGFEPHHVVATFIGTFGQWHGVDVLARAIRHMIDHDRDFLDRTGLRFLLVGDGLKMPIVKEALAGAENGPYVRLAGLVPQKEAPKYLAASDILLSPHVKNPDGTAFFGSPTKLFEYLAMGRGIVASNLDQLGEVLRPAIFPKDAADVEEAVAVLVSPGDQAELIDGMKLLVERPDVRMKLGKNARTLALRKYTWRHHTQAILDALERLTVR